MLLPSSRAHSSNVFAPMLPCNVDSSLSSWMLIALAIKRFNSRSWAIRILCSYNQRFRSLNRELKLDLPGSVSLSQRKYTGADAPSSIRSQAPHMLPPDNQSTCGGGSDKAREVCQLREDQWLITYPNESIVFWGFVCRRRACDRTFVKNRCVGRCESVQIVPTRVDQCAFFVRKGEKCV